MSSCQHQGSYVKVAEAASTTVAIAASNSTSTLTDSKLQPLSALFASASTPVCTEYAEECSERPQSPAEARPTTGLPFYLTEAELPRFHGCEADYVNEGYDLIASVCQFLCLPYHFICLAQLYFSAFVNRLDHCCSVDLLEYALCCFQMTCLSQERLLRSEHLVFAYFTCRKELAKHFERVQQQPLIPHANMSKQDFNHLYYRHVVSPPLPHSDQFNRHVAWIYQLTTEISAVIEYDFDPLLAHPLVHELIKRLYGSEWWDLKDQKRVSQELYGKGGWARKSFAWLAACYRSDIALRHSALLLACTVVEMVRMERHIDYPVPLPVDKEVKWYTHFYSFSSQQVEEVIMRICEVEESKTLRMFVFHPLLCLPSPADDPKDYMSTSKMTHYFDIGQMRKEAAESKLAEQQKRLFEQIKRKQEQHKQRQEKLARQRAEMLAKQEEEELNHHSTFISTVDDDIMPTTINPITNPTTTASQSSAVAKTVTAPAKRKTWKDIQREAKRHKNH